MAHQRMRRLPAWGRVLVLICVLPLLAGCGLRIPSDPDGTLDRVTDGTLRVGVSPNGEFTQVDGDEVSGTEAELVERFAAELHADVAWTVGSEESLIRELDRGGLDLLIAGFTDTTPWSEDAGMTRPYAEFTDQDGARHKLVMLVPLGENAFLSELETFLTEAAEASGSAP